MVIPQILLVIIFFHLNVDAKLPEFICQVDQDGGCRFENVILTKSQPNWQPVANTSDYSSVVDIQIQWSVIPVLTHDICRTFPSIKRFWLYSQHVEEIHENAFENCTKLEIIALVGNPLLTKVPRGLFKNTQRLGTLHIFDNQIQNFELGTFDNLTYLQYLDVKGNNLTIFQPKLLKNNRNLQKLLIYSNELSELDTERLLEYVPKLDYISFNDNEISCVRMVEMVKSLRSRKIYVATNTSIPKKMRYYTQQKVFKDYICNPDVSWSAAHYRKQKDTVHDDENIVKKVKELEERLSIIEEKLDAILVLLSRPSTTEGIPT